LALLAIPTGVGVGLTLFGGFLVGLYTGQVYRIAELSILGRQDEIMNECFHSDDMLIDGLLGAAFTGGGIGIENIISSLKSQTSVSGYIKVEFQGRTVYQLKNIDWDYVDPGIGVSNRQLAKWGNSPVDYNGDEYILHHLLQKEPGPLAEVSTSTHQKYFRILHGQIPEGSSFYNNNILVNQFKQFRTQYWKWRALNID
jgi:hypothetical protein